MNGAKHYCIICKYNVRSQSFRVGLRYFFLVAIIQRIRTRNQCVQKYRRYCNVHTVWLKTLVTISSEPTRNPFLHRFRSVTTSVAQNETKRSRGAGPHVWIAPPNKYSVVDNKPRFMFCCAPPPNVWTSPFALYPRCDHRQFGLPVPQHNRIAFHFYSITPMLTPIFLYNNGALHMANILYYYYFYTRGEIRTDTENVAVSPYLTEYRRTRCARSFSCPCIVVAYPSLFLPSSPWRPFFELP